VFVAWTILVKNQCTYFAKDVGNIQKRYSERIKMNYADMTVLELIQSMAGAVVGAYLAYRIGIWIWQKLP
jgi:uncharacterized membrane protein